LPRLALTGPVAALEEWVEGTQVSGWEIVPCPLIELLPRSANAEDLQGLREFGAPQLIALTSRHAVGLLAELALAEPDLMQLSSWVVGQRTAMALQQVGWKTPLRVEPDAARLTQALLEADPQPSRVLWPRGDMSDELARSLRQKGIRVFDPIAYTNRPRRDVRWPACEWVFFASPSAVDRWLELDGAEAAGAIAIGETTLRRLRDAARDRFSAIIPLPHPTMAALRSCLVELGRAGSK
jgi:uroporphyrinogen-III synthase